MKNENNATENRFIVLSMGIATILLVMSLFSVLIGDVFSNNDTIQMNVTVNNSGPTVSGVNLNDSDGGTIQLSVSNFTTVTCNATLTDLNGYSDITGANATVFYSNDSNNKSNSPDDINYHYTNTSCTLFGGNGINEFANCTVNLSFAAVNGTWTCNVTAIDSSNAFNSTNGTNDVDQLVALGVWNASINFSSMTNGQNTTLAQARGINASNEGNVRLDMDIKALSADMSCVTSGVGCLGAIGVGNMTFNTTVGTYDNMRNGINLTITNQTITNWDLSPKGINTVDTVNSSKYLYSGIQIPQGVKGEFNVNITLSAIIG